MSLAMTVQCESEDLLLNILPSVDYFATRVEAALFTAYKLYALSNRSNIAEVTYMLLCCCLTLLTL